MIRYPEHHEFTPLLVCGLPRAGTRAITNMLNTVPEICIQGEIPSRAFEKVIELYQTVDSIYLDETRTPTGKHGRRWPNRSHELMCALWSNLAKGARPLATEECRLFGQKNPGGERYFEFYEELFAGNPPYYLFCIRNFPDFFLSLTAQRWAVGKNYRFARLMTRYENALKRAEQMIDKCPQRTVLFVLDEFKKHQDRYLEHAILSQFPVRLSSSSVQDMIRMGVMNSSEQKGVERRSQLSDAESKTLAKRADISELFERLRDHSLQVMATSQQSSQPG